MSRSSVVLILSLALFIVGQPAADDAMEPIDVSTCAGCHDDQIAMLARGPHAALDDVDSPVHLENSTSCVACHGDATVHLDEAGEGPIFAFGADDWPTVKANRCLDCHHDAHPRFFASRHAAAGLDCTSCHSIHANDGKSPALLRSTDTAPAIPHLGDASASCAECHGEVFAKFELSERHRLREGILDCASCHDPHEPQSRLALGGFKQQQCTSCHTDKDGPFVFEHGSQRVEGCVACHDPHGSPNRHLLTFQSVADLCYSCHAVVPGFHTRFTADSQCTNCHSTIHGSNFDPFFLK